MQYAESQSLTEEKLTALLTEAWAGLRKLKKDSDIFELASLGSCHHFL